MSSWGGEIVILFFPLKDWVYPHCMLIFPGQMVCSKAADFSCDNLCGNPLPCGNHYCTYVCHALKNHPSDKSDTSCEKCNLACQKVNASVDSHHLRVLWTDLFVLFFLFILYSVTDFVFLLLILEGCFSTSYTSTFFENINWPDTLVFLLPFFRREILYAHILAPCNAILENAPLARHWLSGHVIVVPWYMFLSATILTACRRKRKLLFVHAKGLAISKFLWISCELVYQE